MYAHTMYAMNITLYVIQNRLMMNMFTLFLLAVCFQPSTETRLKIENGRRFINESTIYKKKIVTSIIDCARVCSNDNACCSVGFDETKHECSLNSECYPDTQPATNFAICLTLEETATPEIRTTSRFTNDSQTSAQEKITLDTTSDFGSTSSTVRQTTYITVNENQLTHTSETMSEPTHGQTTNGPITEYSDCGDLPSNSPSGIYWITPFSGPPKDVYCDMETDGGGWTVFQRRYTGEVDFTRNWDEYRDGFGNFSGDHWLGTNFLHILTTHELYKLRIDALLHYLHVDADTMVTQSEFLGYAIYNKFIVQDEASGFHLTIGSHTGDIDDGWNTLNGDAEVEFRTFDRTGGLCNGELVVGWWYDGFGCNYYNLNSKNLASPERSMDMWVDETTWGDKPVLKSKMMIKKL